MVHSLICVVSFSVTLSLSAGFPPLVVALRLPLPIVKETTALTMDAHADTFSHIYCGVNSTQPKVIVSISDVGRMENHSVFTIQAALNETGLFWSVQRRYSEFLELRNALLAFFRRSIVRQCFGCRWFTQSLESFAFPRRHFICSRDAGVIRARTVGLENFVRLLAVHAFSAIPKCVSCSKLPFMLVRDFFMENARVVLPLSIELIREAIVPGAFAAIADPSKSKIEFRRGNGILKVLQSEKPVHSKRFPLEILRRSVSAAAETLPTKPLATLDDEDLDMTGVDLYEELDKLRVISRPRPLHSAAWPRWDEIPVSSSMAVPS